MFTISELIKSDDFRSSFVLLFIAFLFLVSSLLNKSSSLEVASIQVSSQSHAKA
jgi:hypothetical protein